MLGLEADAVSMRAKLRGWKNRVKRYLEVLFLFCGESCRFCFILMQKGAIPL